MMTMGERMGDAEIDEIVGDSDLVNNEYIMIDDFAKMIKRIILTLLLGCILFACGKKGDPQYKETVKKVRMQNTVITKT